MLFIHLIMKEDRSFQSGAQVREKMMFQKHFVISFELILKMDLWSPNIHSNGPLSTQTTLSLATSTWTSTRIIFSFDLNLLLLSMIIIQVLFLNPSFLTLISTRCQSWILSNHQFWSILSLNTLLIFTLLIKKSTSLIWNLTDNFKSQELNTLTLRLF